MSEYHVPVLLSESVGALQIDPDGTYIDVTYGGGGHSECILEKLSSKGRLIAFDQDVQAKDNIIKDDRLIFVESNFRYIYRYWKWMDIDQVDGVLADLGVSSHQIDEKSRGFSYRFDNDLDMRMNTQAKFTAFDVLGKYAQRELADIFSKYGEVRNSKTLATEIVRHRNTGSTISSTSELNAILDKVGKGDKVKYYSQVYQALRMEVNDEMGALRELLEGSLRVLKKGGRLVFISYHSLEDRLVKRFFRSGNVDGKEEKDMYGRSLSKIKNVGKLILPSAEELNRNNRARSAKMRVGVKLID